jgi:hypothetical protein
LSKRRGASVFGVGNCVEANTEHTGMGRRAMAVGERLFHVGSPTFSGLSPIRFDAASVPVFWFSHSPSSGPIGSPTSPVPVLLVLPHPQFRSCYFSHIPSSGPIGSPTA